MPPKVVFDEDLSPTWATCLQDPVLCLRTLLWANILGIVRVEDWTSKNGNKKAMLGSRAGNHASE